MVKQSALRFLFGLALLCILPPSAGALEAFTPSETMDGIFIGKYVAHFADPAKQLTLADVRRNSHESQFVPVNRDTLDFGMSAAAHWIRLKVNNPANDHKHWVMQAEHPLLNHIEVYEIGHNGEVKFHEGGSQIPFERRDIAFRKSSFSMASPPGTTEVYVKVWPNTRTAANCTLTAWGANNFIAQNNIDTLLLGLYYGALLVMCLYNLFIYFSVRDTAYLLYVTYILFAGLSYLVINGLVFQYLWPASPFAGLRFGMLTFIFAILFSRSFLNIKERMPKLDNLLWAFSIFYLLNALLLFFGANRFPSAMTVGYLSSLLFPPLLIYVGFRSLKAGVRQARFYVAAWTVYLVGVMLYFLKDFGVLPHSFITTYSIQIGTLADVLLLSFALADRIKILRDEKEAAQGQVVEQKQRALKIAEEARDNLEKKVAERTAQLEESETRFRGLVESSPDPIVIHSEGRFVYINKAAETFVGAKSSGELIGRNILDFVHPDYHQQVIKNAELLISGQVIFLKGVDEKFLRVDGSSAEVDVSSTLTILDGKPAFQVIFRDVTERKRMERELRNAKEEAENATRLKDKFVSLVTHDLKSPLSSLTLGLETLHKDADDLPPVRRQFIGKMAAHSRELLNMTGRLLDLSRLQAGVIIPENRFINCRGFVDAQIGLYHATATQKEITIVNDIPDGMNVYADPDLFGECVKNVLSNALKFCDKGDTITVFNPPDMPSTIAVKDNGPGIAPEKLPLLFTAEMKMRSLGTAGETGTGIGLPHAKELMEAHGGAITVESAPGMGSTFFLSLPSFNAAISVAQ